MLDLILVDAEPGAHQQQLSQRFKVRHVRTQSAALRAVRRQLPHVLVTTQELGHASGFVLCGTIRANHPEVTTVVHGASNKPLPGADLLIAADAFHPSTLKPSGLEAAIWQALVEHHVEDYATVRPGLEARWASLALQEPYLEHTRGILERNPQARRSPRKLAKLLRTTQTGLTEPPRQLSRIAIFEPDIRARMAMTARFAGRVQLEFIEGLDGLAALAEPVGPKPALVVLRVGPDSPIEPRLVTALTQRRRCQVLVHGGILPDAQVTRQETERLYPELLELVLWEMLDAQQKAQKPRHRTTHIPIHVNSASRERSYADMGWWELMRSPVCIESLRALLFKEIPLPSRGGR